MKTRITQCIPTILVFGIVGYNYFSLWCIFTTKICYGTTISHISLTIAQPLYFFSLFSLPIAIILIFVSRNIFNSWLKLAAWMVPLLLVFIATQPVNATHILSTNRDDAARLAGGVFAAASLILIIWKSFAARRESESVKV